MELEPVKVMFGCAPFSQTVVVPTMVAEGKVVTAMLIVAGTAHAAGALEAGVKLYIEEPAEVVAIVAGDQVPPIVLLEVVGSRSGVAP